MTNLPEAGGVAWTELWTPEGTKINLTSRAETPVMAYKNLVAAIEETGALTVRPAATYSSKPPAPPTQPELQHAHNLGADTHDLGLLDRKPKASDLQPGDRYEMQVDEYEASPVSIRFYRKGMQYPDITHNLNNEVALNKFRELFKQWQPEEDEQRHDIPGGSVILAVQCTTKLNTKNNPYQNLDGLRRP